MRFGFFSIWVAKQLVFLCARFGFVDFESGEVCQKAKKAMEDCQIDGNKVTVAYARSKMQKNLSAAAGDSAEDQPADQNVTGEVSLLYVVEDNLPAFFSLLFIYVKYCYQYLGSLIYLD